MRKMTREESHMLAALAGEAVRRGFIAVDDEGHVKPEREDMEEAMGYFKNPPSTDAEMERAWHLAQAAALLRSARMVVANQKRRRGR